jgi:hypothetical protein
MVTMKAQYLGTCIRKEASCLVEVAERLQTGEMPAEILPQVLRQMERQFRQLSKTAEGYAL